MLRLLRPAITCLLVATGGLAQAKADSYQLDPVHTRVAFRIDHAGLSQAIGTFSGASGSLMFDPDDWSSARLEVTLPLASLDLGDAKWRAKVLDRTFLDAGREPVARFVSTRVEAIDAHHARVTGELSLRGVTREVTLDVTLNALKRHPLTLRRTAGFSATATLSRGAFGMDAWRRVVGDAVVLSIEAEAVRGRTRADKTSPTLEPDDADQEPR